MDLKLELQQSQKLVMTPQLQLAIKLLQFSGLELQQYLSESLNENPLLEEVSMEIEDGETSSGEDSHAERKEESQGASEENLELGAVIVEEFQEPLSPDGWDDYYENDWRTGVASYPISSDEDFPEQILVKPTSLKQDWCSTLEDHLLWQLQMSSLAEREKSIGCLLIGNLDEDGRLQIPLKEIAQEAQVSEDTVESILQHIQTFDPPGVGARDLIECLLIQLRHLQRDFLDSKACDDEGAQSKVLEQIVREYLPDIGKKRYQNVARKLGIPIEEIYEAVHIIEGLEAKPGRPYFKAGDITTKIGKAHSDNNQSIIPDVRVFKKEDEWVVELNEDSLPKLRIISSSDYKNLNDEDKAYLADKERGAQWIMRSLKQRNETILKVVRSLIKFQEDFLERGVQYLKPLVLKSIAEDVGMHESTISRVTSNKYMYCPQGMLELKFFFNKGIQNIESGEEDLSSLMVRKLIGEIVANENGSHPLKDQEIVGRLRSQGIVIARRTIAKYRAELNIAPASQRKYIARA